MTDRGNLEVLQNERAAATRTLGERLRDVHCIGIAVARYVNAADDVFEIRERIQRADLCRPDDVDRETEYLRHGGVALEFFHAAGRGRQRQ